MAYSHPEYHGGKNEVAQVTDEFLTCRLCDEPGFREPKVLTCGHTFCKHCLQRVLGPVSEPWPTTFRRPPNFVPPMFSCTTCRRSMQIPKGGVDGLPDALGKNTQNRRLLMRHNQDRGPNPNTFYNISNYVFDVERWDPRFPKPGESRNIDPIMP